MQLPRSWFVFPCNGKLPATPHGFKDAKPYDSWPEGTFDGKNIALATGKASGVWVLDIDVKNGAQGMYSLEHLEEEHGNFDTLTARTWSGGLHYYFKYVPGIRSRTAVWPGIDVRSDGGYVIIPPSTIEGKPYSFLDVEKISGINAAPEWLIAALTEIKPIPKFTLPRTKEGKIPKGKQDDALFKFACSMTAQGFSPEKIKAALMQAILDCPQDKDNPFTDADIRRWMGSAENYDQGKAKVKLAEEQAAKAQERSRRSKEYAQKAKEKAQRIEALERAGLIYNKQTGTLTSCQANVEQLLRGKYPRKFWRNEFSLSDFFGQARIDDEIENTLHSELEREQRICFRREHVKNGVAELCALNKKNPLRDWLESLTWDNQARLNRIAVEILKASNESAEMLVRKWLISAIARVYDPGCKVDHMLVLIGKQGIGKSSAMRILASDDYFLDHIEDLRDKDTLLKFKGHWICEFQELSAMQRSQIEQVKAFITRKVDVYRAPYGHKEMVIPRMCVFAATTNDDHPLKQEDDENRRFWPVYCAEDALDTEKLLSWREQIWAEAVSAYKAGESIYIQDALLLQDIQTMQKELSDTTDTWEEILQPLFLENWFFMGTAFDKLEIEPGRQSKGDIFRLVRIFKRNGFVRKQVGGGEHRGKRAWIRLENAAETPWYGAADAQNRPEIV